MGAEYIAVVYAEMRQEEAGSKMPHSYTTARTLMSILRLSQALARLRFSNTVLQVPSKPVSRIELGLHCSRWLDPRTIAEAFGCTPNEALEPEHSLI